MTRIMISAGHGLHVRGASSAMMDEVDEARKVVTRVTQELQTRGIDVKSYWDDVSTSQDENLKRLVDWHNAQGPHDLDVSVHFNAFEQTSNPRGCEVWYTSDSTLPIAEALSEAIADAGFIDRGPKHTNDLYFLNHTVERAVLLEICFVDSTADAEIYFNNFDLICESIADLAGAEDGVAPGPEPLFHAKGKASYFGGPDDDGVDEDEGLAFIDDIDDMPQLFLPEQPDGATGLARRLNPFVHYVACRWDYDVTPKAHLLQDVAQVRASKTGLAFKAFPADWGPHEDTGRVADLSPSLMEDLGIKTDDEVEVVFPYRG